MLRKEQSWFWGAKKAPKTNEASTKFDIRVSSFLWDAFSTRFWRHSLILEDCLGPDSCFRKSYLASFGRKCVITGPKMDPKFGQNSAWNFHWFSNVTFAAKFAQNVPSCILLFAQFLKLKSGSAGILFGSTCCFEASVGFASGTTLPQQCVMFLLLRINFYKIFGGGGGRCP